MTKPDDADVLARTLWGEARGEFYQGMQAVANVVMNRCALAKDYVTAHAKPHPLFGDGTPAFACVCPYQFSCWNLSDPNLPKLKKVDATDGAFSQCLLIAGDAVNGTLDDITRGATHYFDRRLPQPPHWAEGKTPCAVIGRHLFFNDIP